MMVEVSWPVDRRDYCVVFVSSFSLGSPSMYLEHSSIDFALILFLLAVRMSTLFCFSLSFWLCRSPMLSSSFFPSVAPSSPSSLFCFSLSSWVCRWSPMLSSSFFLSAVPSLSSLFWPSFLVWTCLWPLMPSVSFFLLTSFQSEEQSKNVFPCLFEFAPISSLLFCHTTENKSKIENPNPTNKQTQTETHTTRRTQQNDAMPRNRYLPRISVFFSAPFFTLTIARFCSKFYKLKNKICLALAHRHTIEFTFRDFCKYCLTVFTTTTRLARQCDWLISCIGFQRNYRHLFFSLQCVTDAVLNRSVLKCQNGPTVKTMYCQPMTATLFVC